MTPECGSQVAAAAYVLAVRKGDDVKFDLAVIALVQYLVSVAEAFSAISQDPSKAAVVQLAEDCNCCARSQKIVWCPHAKVRVGATYPPDLIVVMVARWGFGSEKHNDLSVSAWSMEVDVAAYMQKDTELKVHSSL